AAMKAESVGAGGDFKNIRAQQRLAARENQSRHAKGLEVLHDVKNFVRGQLVRKVDIGGNGVAMFARQIAASNQIPDHDRPWWIAARRHRCGIFQFLQKLGHTEHGDYSLYSLIRRPVFFRMRVLHSTVCWRQASPSTAAMAATCASVSLR